MAQPTCADGNPKESWDGYFPRRKRNVIPTSLVGQTRKWDSFSVGQSFYPEKMKTIKRAPKKGTHVSWWIVYTFCKLITFAVSQLIMAQNNTERTFYGTSRKLQTPLLMFWWRKKTNPSKMAATAITFLKNVTIFEESRDLDLTWSRWPRKGWKPQISRLESSQLSPFCR